MYEKRNPVASPTAYATVSGGDGNGRGNVEMKAMKRPTVGLKIEQLAETGQVDLHLNGDQDETPTLSKSDGTDMQRVILCHFGILGFVSLAILYGAMLGIVVSTNSNLHGDIRRDLSDQADYQAHATLNEAGDFLVRVLQSYDQSVLSMTDFTCRNVFRPDFNTPLNGFPTNSTSLYYDLWNGDTPPTENLKAPLTASARFNGKMVSRGASAGFATNQVMSDIRNWNRKLNDTMRLTSFLDEDFINMWDAYPQILQIYIGFDTSPPSFRRYPGRPILTEAAAEGNAAKTAAMAYNPPQRPWYIAAIAKRTETIYTAPYPDFHGLGWMITGARAVYDATNSNSPIGVVGIDLLMGDIAEVLNGIKFLSTGKLSLFHGISGQVVTDAELNYATATSNMYYSDLKKPAISTSLWESIAATPAGLQSKFVLSKDGDVLEAGEDDLLADENQYLYVKHLTQYGGQYYLVVIVAAKEILAPVTPALDKMTNSNITTSLVLMISLVVSMVFLLGMMMLMMRSIIKVFNILQENVEKLLRNVGTASGLGDGMVEVHEAASNELYELQNSMNIMIQNMQAGNNSQNALSDASGGGTLGKTGQQQLEALWNFVPMKSNLDASAPPIAQAYLIQD